MSKELSLLRRAQRWEKRAMAEIYDLYSPELYRYAMRLLGDQSLAEDCVAETFTRFLQALKRNRGPTDYLRAYLYRIAHNWITDQYRRIPNVTSLESEIHSDNGSNPDISVPEFMERRRVRAALNCLTPEQRQVVALRFLEGWKLQEVAETTNKSLGAVKAMQHRALATLQRILTSEEEPECLSMMMN